MKRQVNIKDFKRFGAFKGVVEQKTLYSTRSCVNWTFFGPCGPLKRWFHSRFNLVHWVHSYQKKPNLHTNYFERFILIYDTRKLFLVLGILFNHFLFDSQFPFYVVARIQKNVFFFCILTIFFLNKYENNYFVLIASESVFPGYSRSAGSPIFRTRCFLLCRRN
jgi:hypothetical protein